MMRNKTDATTLVTVIVAIISAYVLFFSTMPLLYKIFIIAFSFVLLFLVTFALQSLETIGKRRPS
jgi:ABC-type amino acid transport system permease subunit